MTQEGLRSIPTFLTFGRGDHLPELAPPPVDKSVYYAHVRCWSKFSLVLVLLSFADYVRSLFDGVSCVTCIVTWQKYACLVQLLALSGSASLKLS